MFLSTGAFAVDINREDEITMEVVDLDTDLSPVIPHIISIPGQTIVFGGKHQPNKTNDIQFSKPNNSLPLSPDKKLTQTPQN